MRNNLKYFKTELEGRGKLTVVLLTISAMTLRGNTNRFKGSVVPG